MEASQIAPNEPSISAAPALLQQSDKASTGHKYLSFVVADQVFGLGILGIKEILEYGTLGVVPMAPPHVRGVVNLRGNVVPVIDLGSRLGKEGSQPTTKRTCIVIIELGSDDHKVDVGVIVDSVTEVLTIAPCDIEPPPSFGMRIRPEFIQGMARVQGRFVVLLDVERTLNLDELAELNEAQLR